MLLRDQEINVKIMGDESSREAFIKAVQSSDVTYESLKDFPVTQIILLCLMK